MDGVGKVLKVRTALHYSHTLSLSLLFCRPRIGSTQGAPNETLQIVASHDTWARRHSGRIAWRRRVVWGRVGPGESMVSTASEVTSGEYAHTNPHCWPGPQSHRGAVPLCARAGTAGTIVKTFKAYLIYQDTPQTSFISHISALHGSFLLLTRV